MYCAFCSTGSPFEDLDRPAQYFIVNENLPVCARCARTFIRGWNCGRLSNHQPILVGADEWCPICAHTKGECECESIYNPEEPADLRVTHFGIEDDG